MKSSEDALRQLLANVSYEPLFTEDDEQAESAFQKIARLVAHRDRSRSELFSRLVQDGYEHDVANRALKRAQACGLISDERFAQTLIASRLAQHKGLAGLYREFRQHNLDSSLIDTYLAENPSVEGNQIQEACQVLFKKPPRAKNKLQAAYAKLMRMGYSSSVATQAAREWYAQQQDTSH